jgi:hypothetical protein
MRRNLMRVLVVGGVCAGAAAYVGKVMATPASGFTSTSLAVGRVAEFDVMHKLVWDDPDPANSKKHVWHSSQNTKGDSDLYVQSNLWVAGGTSGWHTHPGHSLITVTAGTVTAYEGHDPTKHGRSPSSCCPLGRLGALTRRPIRPARSEGSRPVSP